LYLVVSRDTLQVNARALDMAFFPSPTQRASNPNHKHGEYVGTRKKKTTEKGALKNGAQEQRRKAAPGGRSAEIKSR
jgi:hypothetical protein